jgi:hypothetical protein
MHQTFIPPRFIVAGELGRYHHFQLLIISNYFFKILSKQVESTIPAKIKFKDNRLKD